MANLLVSSFAEQDIESIFRYTIRQWGFDQADTYLELLVSSRDSIVANPFLPGSKAREDLAAGCRTFRCGKHVYFYRFHDNNVEIARVLHESMDFEQHIAESHFP